MAVVNHLNTLTSIIRREKFLSSKENRFAAGMITTSEGGTPTQDGLYAPGRLHHHVLTRRPLKKAAPDGRDGRLLMATYGSFVREGCLRWQMLWGFDLSVTPEQRAFVDRSPYRPVPADDGVTASIAVAMTHAVLSAAAGGPVDRDLRMSRSLCAPPGGVSEQSIAYDSRPVLRMALAAANGQTVVPDCVAPYDAVVVAVRTAYMERRDQFIENPRTTVLLRRKELFKPQEDFDKTCFLNAPESDVLVELPEACQLSQPLADLANGRVKQGDVLLRAGEAFAWPLKPGARTRWGQVRSELGDPKLAKWLQTQAVMAAAQSDRGGLPPADTQKADPRNKLFERCQSEPGMVMVVDLGYNRNSNQKLRESADDGVASVLDLWSLSHGLSPKE